MARANDTITQRIALEGGEEIKKALQDLGKAGEKAFADLQKAIRTANGPVGQFDRSMSRLKQRFESVKLTAFGLGVSLAVVGLNIRRLARHAAVANAAVGGVATGLVALTKLGTNAAQEAGRQAQALGLTIEEYTRLSAVAKLAGVDATQFAQALTKLNKELAADKGRIKIGDWVRTQYGWVKATEQNIAKLQELENKLSGTRLKIGDWARTQTGWAKVTEQNIEKLQELQDKLSGTGEKTESAGAAMRRLGIQYRDAQGNIISSGELLKRLADQFAKMPDGAEKAALAVKLFGEELGPRLVPLLNQGADGIRKLGQDFEDLGIGTALDKQRFEIAERFNRLWDTISLGLRQRRVNFGIELAAAFQQPMESLLESLKRNHKTIDDTLAGLAKSIESFVTDVVNAFAFAKQGDEFVFFNEHQVSEQRKWLIDLRDGIIGVGTTIAQVWRGVILPIFKAVRAAANGVAQAINAIFGTQLTGDGLLVLITLGKLLGLFQLLFFVIANVVTVFRLLTGAMAVARTAMIALIAALTPKAIVAWFVSLAAKVGTFLKSLLTLRLSFSAIWAAAGRALGAILLLLTRIAAWPLLLIAGLGLIAGYWNEIVAFARKAWDGIKLLAQGAWDGVVQMAKDSWEGVKRIAQGAWAGVKQMAADAWEGIKALPRAMWAALLAGARDAWAGVEAIASDSWEVIKHSSRRSWQGIKTAARDTWDGVETMATDIWEAFKLVGSRAFQGLKTIGADVFGGILDTAKSFAQSAAELVVSIWTGATDAVKASATAIREAITRATEISQDVGGAAKLAEQLAKPFRDAVATIDTLMGQTLPQLVRSGASLVENEIAAMARTIETHLTRIKQLLAEALSAVRASTTAPTMGTPMAGGAMGMAGGGLLETIVGPYREAARLIQEIMTVRIPEAVMLGLQQMTLQWQTWGAAMPEQITLIGQTMVAALQSALTLMSGLVQQIMALLSQLVSAFQTAADQVASIMARMASSVEAAVARIIAAVERAIAALARLRAAQAASGGGGGGGFARGGYVTGPGTETSDSIPAWLSRGEFVIRAAAVRKYGLGLLSAINGMRISGDRLKMGLPAFAMGGLVDAMAPRIPVPAVASAGGGVSGRPFNLHIGSEVFSGLIAPEDTARQLQQYATQMLMRSSGRRPTWYGG